MIKTANTTTINEGETVTFTISAQNFGVDPATNLVVNEVLPPGLSLVSATPSAGSWSVPNWTVGTLTSGTLETIDIVAMAMNVNNTPYANKTNIAFNTQDQSDSNITEDTPFVSVLVNYDNDGDSVIDSTDLDDDNDGILDTIECTPVLTNFALSGTATLSSPYPSGDASKAIDGNTDGSWSSGSVAHSGCGTNNDWLTVDLGTNKLIDEIRIWNRTDCCSERLSNAYVMISSNPFPANTDVEASLTNAEFIFQIGNTNGVPQVSIPAGLKARYIRLQKSGNNLGGNCLNIAELQVLGSETCDTDSDNTPDSYDFDSDNDGCSDANEAYNDSNADGGDGGTYGTGTPPATNGNGTVTAASYPAPADLDTNGISDFQETGSSPTISVAPLNQRVFLGNDGTVEVSSSDSDTYQWEVSTDGGTTFDPIADGGEYSGTQTDELSILNPELDKNGYVYRAILLSDTFICGQTQTNEIVLSVGPRTIITNRRITIRVNKN